MKVKTNGKMKFQEVKSFRSKNGYLCIMCKVKKAKKLVIGVSSKLSNTTTNVTSKHGKLIGKPTLIHEYNQSIEWM